MSHRRAVLVMIGVTLMWSIAGVVSRFIEQAKGFELTFWRSAFTVPALLVLLVASRGWGPLWRSVREGGRALWISGICWCVMFTAFMMALSLTTVANVLITLAVAPLFTALASRLVLGHRLAPRTWVAILTAGAGIAWMYGREVSGADPRHLAGTLVALGVPVAAAVNWTLLQHINRTRAVGAAPPGDMLPAVLIGAVMSALLTLPLSLPFSATPTDLGWLALLGTVQLAIPCLLAVTVSKVLSAPEVSLLALLEVVFGVAWAWLGAGEAPSGAVIWGGALVLGAMAMNEGLALRERSTLSQRRS